MLPLRWPGVRAPMVIALGAVVLLGGAAWLARPSAGVAQPLESVTLAVNTRYAGSCSVLLAKELGHFSDEGVAATIQHHPTGRSALKSVLQGNAELATVADIPVMFAAMDGQPVSIVATIFRAQRNQGIVARRDHGIAGAADLRGKRIGVPFGTTANYFVDAFVLRQKIPAPAVTVIDLDPQAITGALMGGQVDAISIWEPYLGRARAELGDRAATFYSEGLYDVTFNLVSTAALVAARPLAVEKVLRAVLRGARVCKESPDAAATILARYFKTSPAQERALWPLYSFEVTLDQALVLGLEDQTRWAMRNRLTSGTAMPDYLDRVHIDALLAVQPSAVTIIH